MNPIPQHERGERVEAMHQCPDCSGRGLFCPLCLGETIITTAQLARWQREQDQIIARGGAQ